MSSIASTLDSNAHMKNQIGIAVNSISDESVHKNLLQRKLSLDEGSDGWCHIYHMKRNDSITSNSDKLTVGENSKGSQAENIHLYLSDLLLSSVEQRKWRTHTKDIDFTRDPGPILLPASDANLSDQPSTSSGIFSNNSSEKRTGNSIFYADVEDIKEELEGKSLERMSEFSESEQHYDDPISDEIISALMKFFEREKMENPEDFVCMVSFADAPQNLLPIPNEIPVPLDEVYTVDGKRIRLRGSTVWAPPKKKFIFDLVKTTKQDRPKLLAQQNFRCAGCGMKLNNLYAERSKICHYYNKVFCQCCHQGATARIPARVLHQWNFSLKTVFTSAPSRFLTLDYVEFYSLIDFERVRNGNLIEMFEPIVLVGGCHIENCLHCQQRAFLCQICIRPDSFLFSFQLEQVHRCEGCGALSHMKCYHKIKKGNPDWKCARCERIARKKIRQENSSSEDSYNSD